MSLKNSSWRLSAFETFDGIEPVLPGTTITAAFRDSTMGGSGGCNTYGADVAYDEGEAGSIKVSNLFSTQMFCSDPPGVSEQESKYFEFLSAASRFSQSGNKLRITDGSKSARALSFDLCETTPVVNEIESRDWYAWNNKMPPKPDDFHVVGELKLANPGIEPTLVPSVPQGINPKILLMDLHLRQLPGAWPRVITWKQVRYDKIMVNSDYDSVNIFFKDNMIADFEVEDVH